MTWADGPLLAFDTETTGVDVDRDRVVTASLVSIQPGKEPAIREWLVNPGIEIPAEATAVHGVTTEHAKVNGVPPEKALREIHKRITTAWNRQIPIVIYNAPYDLTLLDRELRRHTTIPGLGSPGVVIDPLVLDKAMDRFRRGSRKLVDVCAHYGITLSEEEAHTSSGDALAAARLAWVLAHRYPLFDDLIALHLKQMDWYQIQAESFEAYLRERKRRDGATEDEASAVVIDRQWPIRYCSPTTREVA